MRHLILHRSHQPHHRRTKTIGRYSMKAHPHRDRRRNQSQHFQPRPGHHYWSHSCHWRMNHQQARTRSEKRAYLSYDAEVDIRCLPLHQLVGHAWRVFEHLPTDFHIEWCRRLDWPFAHRDFEIDGRLEPLVLRSYGQRERAESQCLSIGQRTRWWYCVASAAQAPEHVEWWHDVSAVLDRATIVQR